MTEIKKGGLADFMGEAQAPKKAAAVKPRRRKKKGNEPADTTLKVTRDARDKVSAIKTFIDASNSSQVIDAMFEAYMQSIERSDQRLIERILERKS